MTDERDDRQADLRVVVQRLRQDIDECWAPLYHSTKAERDIAEAQVARVEALHVVGFGGEFCRECGNVSPCATVRALDGDA